MKLTPGTAVTASSTPRTLSRMVRQARRMLRRAIARKPMATGSRNCLEPLEPRVLLSGAPVIELSSLLASGGGDGSTGFVIDGLNPGDRLGTSVQSAGDINGDGLDDLIIGAPYAAPNGNATGAAFVVFGRAGGFPAELNLAGLNGTNGFRVNGGSIGNRTGVSVSSAGDVNGDGYDDLLIGSNFAAGEDGKNVAGRTHLIYGKDSRLPNFFLPVINTLALDGTNGTNINGVDFVDFSGRSVDSAGDVNGDGYSDLIIGANGADFEMMGNVGESYVVLGRPEGFGSLFNLSTLDGVNGFTLTGDAPGEQSGVSVSSAGDLNGDGVDDLLVGASLADAAGTNAGRAYVVFGDTGGFDARTDLGLLDGSDGFVLEGAAEFDFAGASVSVGHDVNGDGVDDLLIGAYGSDAAAMNAGRGYVVFGKTTSFAASLDLGALDGVSGFAIDGAAAGDQLGGSIRGAGDVNGDGYDDIILGARTADPGGRVDAGAAYVVLGHGGPFDASMSVVDLDGMNGFALNGITAGDMAGRAVAGAGDVNGDGFHDLVVGAPRTDVDQDPMDPNPNDDSGRAFVIFGGDFAMTVTEIGTSGPDLIQGDANPQQFVGGQDDDTVIGGGGADVLLGGQGNDILAISDDTFRRVDGGGGVLNLQAPPPSLGNMDRLRLDGQDMDLDLTLIPDNRLAGIEIIDLSLVSSGSNTLTLQPSDVLNLSDTSNRLIVLGGEAQGDQVVSLAGWVPMGQDMFEGETVRVFRNGAAELWIDDDVQFNVLTGVVFNDANLSGAMDPDEMGIAGVTVDIYADVNMDQMLDGNDIFLRTALTDGDGAFIFAGVPDGHYLIDVTDLAGVLDGFDLTTGNDPAAVDVPDELVDPVAIGYLQDGAGDSFEEPKVLDLGDDDFTMSDFVFDADPADFYQFTVTQKTSRFIMTLSGLSADADLALLDANGTPIDNFLPKTDLPGTVSERFVLGSLDAGDYTIRITSADNQTTPYTVTIGQITQQAVDVTGDLDQAGLTMTGDIGAENLQDMFLFTASRATEFVAQVTGLTDNLNLRLLNAAGDRILQSSNPGTQDERFTMFLEEGDYTVMIYSVFTESGDPMVSDPVSTSGYSLKIHQMYDQATPIEEPQSFMVDDFVSGTDFNDYYTFDLNQDGLFTFELSGLTANANMRLLDGLGNTITGSFTPDIASEEIVRVLPPGEYGLRVYPVGPPGTQTNYSLSVMQWIDTGGDTLEDATPVQTGVDGLQIQDFVGQSDFEDFFSFTVDTASDVQIAMNGLVGNANLRLLDGNGDTVASSLRSGTSSELILTRLEPGDYFLRVYSINMASTTYNLVMSQLQQDATVVDLETPGNLSLNGEVGPENPLDYYTFELTSAATLDLLLTDMTDNANVRILDENGDILAIAFNVGPADDMLSENLGPGKYTVRVYQVGLSTTTPYTLNLSI